jgi:nucleotide-binding universal stress UspA family protein
VALVVGIAPDGGDSSALRLAGSLARSSADRVVVCTVVASAWIPPRHGVDTEYRAHLDQRAAGALVQARSRMPPDIDSTFVVQHARSVPAGLLEVADEHDASLVILGSSPGGLLGRVALGSVTDRLLHGAHCSLAIAPRGFRCGPDARVERVTAAFGDAAGAHDLIVATAAIAARIGASLRIASFAVRPSTPFAGTVVSGGDDLVVNEWIKGTVASIQEELTRVRARHDVPQPVDVVVGQGLTWSEALEDAPWCAGDVLAVGSSSAGPAARVFLGTRASKILRRSPVPVIMLPRAAA